MSLFFRKYKTLIIAIIALIVLVSAIVIGISVPRMFNKSAKESISYITPTDPVLNLNLRNTSISQNMSLSVIDLATNWDASTEWNIVQETYGQEYVQLYNNNTEVHVLYPTGSYSPSSSVRGGFQFYAHPNPFPNDQISLSYSVFFPNNFNWVKGGKLPGVWIGDVGAYGGTHLTTGASVRVMWRSGGIAEAYVYTPGQQHPSFYNLPGYTQNGVNGESIWRGQYRFIAGAWNNIKITVLLNTQNESNGWLGLTINGMSTLYQQMTWRFGEEKINGLMMQSFFGGNDPSWATPINQYIQFSQFFVTQNTF